MFRAQLAPGASENVLLHVVPELANPTGMVSPGDTAFSVALPMFWTVTDWALVVLY
jgi:hypothetical protein